MRGAISRRAGGAWGEIFRGVVIAIAATALLVVVFALLISLFRFADGTIRTVNQLIKLCAILIGVWFAVKRGGEQGLLRGAAVGLVYMAAGVLVYAALTGQRLTAFAYAADLLMGVAAGGLAGLIRGRM